MSHTVLLVDDEPAITSALEYPFQTAGYTLLIAHSGERAIELLSAEQPDIVVLDIMLGDMTGYDVCAYIRRAERYVPVLMLTARDLISDQIVGLDAGADVYMTKPFEPRAVVAQVRALLRRTVQEEAHCCAVRRAGAARRNDADHARRAAAGVDDAGVRVAGVFDAEFGADIRPNDPAATRVGGCGRIEFAHGGHAHSAAAEED